MIHTLQHLLHAYGYPVLIGLVALECAGLLVPGETMMVAASLLAAHGHLNIYLVLLSAGAGGIIGNVAGYFIGRAVGHRLLARHGWRIGLTARRLSLGRYLFARHGGKVIFFSRFISVLRSFAAPLAGANDMPWRPFLAFTVAGAIAWPATYGFAAFWLGSAVKRLSGPASVAFGAVVVLAIVLVIIFARRHESQLTEAALRWETHHENA